MTANHRKMIKLRISSLPERQRQRDKDRAERIARERLQRERRELKDWLEMEISGYGINYCREWLREHAIEFEEKPIFGFTKIIAKPGVSMMFDRAGNWACYEKIN